MIGVAVMITLNFLVQTICVILWTHVLRSKWEVCPKCNGLGKVELPVTGIYMMCDACDGKKRVLRAVH